MFAILAVIAFTLFAAAFLAVLVTTIAADICLFIDYEHLRALQAAANATQ